MVAAQGTARDSTPQFLHTAYAPGTTRANRETSTPHERMYGQAMRGRMEALWSSYGSMLKGPYDTHAASQGRAEAAIQRAQGGRRQQAREKGTKVRFAAGDRVWFRHATNDDSSAKTQATSTKTLGAETKRSQTTKRQESREQCWKTYNMAKRDREQST